MKSFSSYFKSFKFKSGRESCRDLLSVGNRMTVTRLSRLRRLENKCPGDRWLSFVARGIFGGRARSIAYDMDEGVQRTPTIHMSPKRTRRPLACTSRSTRRQFSVDLTMKGGSGRTLQYLGPPVTSWLCTVTQSNQNRHASYLRCPSSVRN